jgi:hypothetical protein
MVKLAVFVALPEENPVYQVDGAGSVRVVDQGQAPGPRADHFVGASPSFPVPVDVPDAVERLVCAYRQVERDSSRRHPVH